jgi:hypothetical protein
VSRHNAPASIAHRFCFSMAVMIKQLEIRGSFLRWSRCDGLPGMLSARIVKHLKIANGMSFYLKRHPEGRKRAKRFLQFASSPGDLLFRYGKGLLRLHDGQHFTACALYSGVTAFFYMRVWQHKNNQGGYFTTKYKCSRWSTLSNSQMWKRRSPAKRKSRAGAEKRRTSLSNQ